MWKFKLFIHFDKEEKWLNEMAKDGYHLEKASFGYQFQIGKPEDATIKVDYRKFKNRDDFVDYCTLFADSGWQHIAGNKSSGYQYFKKVDESGLDNIFSDKVSNAGKYQRLSKMFLEIALLYVPVLIVFILSDIIDIEAFINPKKLYFTPGLWEMTGTSFWFSFLFETPFAFMRGFAWFFIPVTMLLCLAFGVKANSLYKKSLS
ncbi:DUF2812 domain-containing protein [Pseudogracilibacillus auburnensis]|nr:DUF2812 domain-containing protein [Pseudogracilibacillus auburnensis]MBO1003888.1 DUF2812 domain-containing protein [Pseudogracilibacillus auburnensis]